MPSLAASCRAIANPTAPAPITWSVAGSAGYIISIEEGEETYGVSKVRLADGGRREAAPRPKPQLTAQCA